MILKSSVILALLGFIITCLLWDSKLTVNTTQLNISEIPYSAVSAKKNNLPKEYKAVAGLIKRQEQMPWFQEANKRVEDHRKADLVLVLKDSKGYSIADEDVAIELKSHDFHHGGVMSIWQFSGIRKNTKPYVKPSIYHSKFLELFNATGFNNAFKPKLKNGHAEHLPKAIEWTQQHQIPLRGHTLIWPGEKHLPKEVLKEKSSKSKLRKACNTMIRSWVQKWQLSEWDVINEPRANHLVQDILGKEEEAKWFKLAKTTSKDPNVQLYLNDYQIVSGIKDSYKDIYEKNAQVLLDQGAPLHGLGVQSRFKFDISPEQIYKNLTRLNKFNLPIKGTEFEVVDLKRKLSDQERAKITFQVASTYFSHHLVKGLYVWTIFKSSNEAMVNGKPSWGYSSFMINQDGSLKANGLIWKYLFKHLWTSDLKTKSNTQGIIKTRVFKGRYKITFTHEGKKITRTIHLDKDQIIEIKL
jgi:endo-1,4-beta-xylanase